MSKKKITRLRRPTAGKATWTDAEVLALVDAVLLARDSELAERIFNVLSSRYGPGANRGSTLVFLDGGRYGLPRIHDVAEAPEKLGRLLNALEEDPTNRGKLKRLVATIGKELARGRAKRAASFTRHQVPA